MSKAAVIYWSGTGNTEAMANAIQKGMKEKGIEVTLCNVAQADNINLNDYEFLAFGCPSMGSEVLEESEFEPYFSSIENTLSGKKVALFGSYGWGDGEWMRDWVSRVQSANVNLFGEGLIMQETPDEDECLQYGRDFAGF